MNKYFAFIFLSFMMICCGCDDDNDKTSLDDKTPSDDTTQTEGRVCGSETCTGDQLCQSNHCVDRNPHGIVGQTCNKETFQEYCDNNQVVFCSCGGLECLTEVSDCGSDICAQHATRNYAFCVKPDDKCTAATAGEMTFCYLLQGNINAYLEFFDCAIATDGKYYPFRNNHETTDCIGACIDDYSCNLNDESCDPETFQSRCEGDIAVMCSDMNTVYRMNCGDYGIGCMMGDDGATCEW